MSFILYTNAFVALCAAALVAATRVTLGEPFDPGLLELHVWFATMTVYNIDRLVDEDDQLHASERHVWIANHRSFLSVITAVAAMGTLVTMTMLARDVVLGLAPLAVISFLYSVPIFGADFRLKSVPGAKTFVIAAVWAVVTVILPAWELEASTPWLVLGERFAFVFAITLPFELRDVRRDSEAGVASLAHFLGARGTIGLAVSVLLLGAGVALFRGSAAAAVALVASALLTALATRPRSDWYYSLVLDGTMLLYAMAVIV